MTDLAAQVCLGLTLTLIAVFALFVNILVLVVWCRKAKIRNPQFYFLINLVIVDILAICTWTSLSITAVIGDGWILPEVVCRIHSYFLNLTNILNNHTLLVLALERVLKFFKPSKHEDICLRFFIILFICGLWFFDGVICVFSSVQWAHVRYYPSQYQCIPEYQLSVSHMNFMFVMSYGFLLLAMVVCYPACFIKMCVMRRSIQPSGALVLETNRQAKGDSYADRMKRSSEMFQNAGMKSAKPKLEQTYQYTNDGYIKSADDDANVQKENSVTKPKFKKKQYSLAKEDYMLMKVYVIVSCTYVSAWFPYVIVSYVWTYSRFTPIATGVVTALVWFTHCGLFIKPILYGLLFKPFRNALSDVLKTCKKRK